MQSVLASYGSDDETAETEPASKPKDDEERAKLRAQAEKFDSLLNQAKKAAPQKIIKPVSSSAVAVSAAPDVGVLSTDAPGGGIMIANASKVMSFNPRYESLWSAEQGPKNPFYRDGITPGMRNHLGASIERTNLADFHFEEQFQTFNSFGYAMDPAAMSDCTGRGTDVVGDKSLWAEIQGRSVHQATKSDAKKRRLTDPAAEKVLAGRGTALSMEEAEEMAAVVAAAEEEDKVRKAESEVKAKDEEANHGEVQSIFHGKKERDYQGRTWLDPPSELKPRDLQSYLPKESVHTWSGHTAGVHAIRWFPTSGHLLLSCSMDCKIKIWDVYNSRKCVRTYMGHSKPVRDICFTEDGRSFTSASFDKLVRWWDTETGTCVTSWRVKGIPYCCKIHPGDNNVLAGCSNKNVIQWDPREPNDTMVQEYVQHLGSVNTINFIDGNRRVVTSSDDKKIFLWEYGIGTAPMKHVSEPWMHSMPAITPMPHDDGNPKYLLCQSLDNQILVYACGDRFKLSKKKHFVGHTIAGYACQVGVSNDSKYVISGDGDGRLWIWDWKSCKVYRKLRGHEGVCIGAIWHPVEQSKVATCGWDGLIKFWD